MFHINRTALIIICILVIILNSAPSLSQIKEGTGEGTDEGTGEVSDGTKHQSADTGSGSVISGTGSRSEGSKSRSTSSGSGSSGDILQPTSTTKYFDIKKDKDPSEPKKRDNITIKLDVYSYTKDINKFSLKDELPMGSDFVSSDPPYDFMEASKPNKGGTIVWNYSYSKDNRPSLLEFKYSIKINKKYDKKLTPAIISWTKNGDKKYEWSNVIHIDIPNDPPKIECDQGSVYSVFGYGERTIKALISDPDGDNLSCFLYINDKKIKPNRIINEINGFFWILTDLPSEEEIFIIAEDDEGLRERKTIKIENPLDFVRNLMDYLHVISAIIAAILGTILTLIFKDKFNIKKANSNSKNHFSLHLTQELDSINKSIEEIGQSNSCITDSVIQEIKKALINDGYEEAMAYASKLVGIDQDTELQRVLLICKKNNLTPEATILVLNNLNKIESGKWENND